ncbi:MAG: proteasome assembly chaperone family protein [Nitrosopumilaceae archaeon]
MHHNGFPEAEVHELAEIKLDNPIIFAGFVGAGLAGSIAVGYIIEKLKMKEIGYMRSKYLPPATVFIQGRLRHPFRFYANKSGTICGIICEIILRMEGLYTISSSILDWAEKNGSKEIVVLDGVPSKESHDQKAFCAAEEDLCRVMADKGINMIPQGFVTGIPGGILNECLIRKIRGVTLLVRANPQRPDPLAAATLVDAVNRAYETGIDTTELRKEAEQIGQDFKELSDKYAEARKSDSGLYM